MGADNDKNAEEQMTTVFLSGSRKITRLNDVIRERIQNVIDLGSAVLIGDANGADKAMQTFLAERKYSNVSVYHVGDACRNNIGFWAAMKVSVSPKLKGRALYTEKDKAMAAMADYGLVLWDGKSAGSITNVCELLTREKKTAVYFSPRKEFISVKTAEDIKTLLSLCEHADVCELENSPILKQQMENLNLSSQQSFDI